MLRTSVSIVLAGFLTGCGVQAPEVTATERMFRYLNDDESLLYSGVDVELTDYQVGFLQGWLEQNRSTWSWSWRMVSSLPEWCVDLLDLEGVRSVLCEYPDILVLRGANRELKRELTEQESSDLRQGLGLALEASQT